MTANHDSALRQALVAAEKAIRLTEALDERDNCDECGGELMPELCGACFPMADAARLARWEAHALIQEALQRGEKT